MVVLDSEMAWKAFSDRLKVGPSFQIIAAVCEKATIRSLAEY
jgi:hypothetical protein